MEDLCRICRKSCQFNSIPLLSSHNEIPLKQMLTKTCPIDITFDDPVSQLLPQSICTDCLEVVTAAYNLQQVCIESDQYFRSLVAGDLVTVKSEKFEDEFAVKFEEVPIEMADVKVKVEIKGAEEPLPKRRKRSPQTYFFESDELVRPSKQPMQHSEGSDFRPRRYTLAPESGISGSLQFYFCNFCDVKMRRRYKLLAHMQSHCPVPFPFPCEYCTERFVDEDGLIQHGNRAHSKSDIKSTLFCDICGVSGNRKEGLDHHMGDDHQGLPRKYSTKKSKFSKCPHCFRYVENSVLDKHIMKKHRGILKCDQCGAEVKGKTQMDHHIMTVHEKMYRQLEEHEIEVGFKCCLCLISYETEDELLGHSQCHETTFVTANQNCCRCPKVLKSYEEFIEHGKYHSMVKTQECLTCKRTFPFEAIKAHVKRHQYFNNCAQKQRLKDFEADDQGKVTDRAKKMKETTFICPICASSLSNLNSLNMHIRSVHCTDEDKRFKCKSCPSKFVQLHQLKKHQAIHTTERPHVCEICGRAFKLPYGLKKHIKRHDPNVEKKFECSQCSFKFAEKNKLTQHLLTHSGLKPHECKFCDRAYASKGDLVKHMQKLHVGDEIYQCDKCSRGFRLMIELREHQAEHTELFS